MKKLIYIAVIAIISFSCKETTNTTAHEQDVSTLEWQEIVESSRGKTVTMMMWSGDPKINSYMNNYVKPILSDRFGINFEVVNGQGNTIVQLLMTEKQAGKKSNIDMMWINGETFYQLRQVKALYGPFVDQLPNSKYIDFDNPFIGMDFQQPIDGYEAPWGNVQQTIIYNSDQVTDLPQTREELLAFAKANPGKLTFDNHFTGLTFLKSLLIDIAGGKYSLSGSFDQEKYDLYAPQLWDYINKLKPYLWKQGDVFPENVAQMHQLFANGEIWFTMSNNDAEVDNKINEGLFPSSSRAYVPEFGSILNSHYLGIADNAVDKAAAMTVINFLICPEAQLKKQDPTVWGDGSVLDITKLNNELQKDFSANMGRKYAPKRSEIKDRALMELAPEYMIQMAEDFRTKVINN